MMRLSVYDEVKCVWFSVYRVPESLILFPLNPNLAERELRVSTIKPVLNILKRVVGWKDV